MDLDQIILFNILILYNFKEKFSLSFSTYCYFHLQCVELLIRSLKDCLKSSKWEEARYLVRFVSDLVNCHVISAGSLLQLLDNFVDAALEEGVPQVSLNVLVLCLIVTFIMILMSVIS